MKHDRPRAGLLPLYLALYDERLPGMRNVLTPFLDRVIASLNAEAITVVQAPVCRRQHEIADAVARFESDGVDCIVTLHLAYSPSLEALGPLLGTSLPIVMCDTTTDYVFDQAVDPERLLYNHGIHGVQDLASTLRRHGRVFMVCAGHLERSDVIWRTANAVHGARCAGHLRRTRVLRVGPVFEGMGDFAVPDTLLKSALGIYVDQIDVRDLVQDIKAVSDKQIDDEIDLDRQTYLVEADTKAHRRSVRVGLGLRGRLERGSYDAFSMHFGHFASDDPDTDTTPFAEASKAMARGLGYAGEGDVLCAALVGALIRGFGDTTFTEMFCPDWSNGSVFLSHMGEFNPSVADPPCVLCDKPMPFCDSRDTVVITGGLRPGRGCLVNLAPQPDNGFAMIVSPVEVLADNKAPEMRGTVRGWVRPDMALPRFLERYSELGGTHHVALVLDKRAEALCGVAKWLGIPGYRIS